MSTFRDRSKTSLRNLSLAAEWMMRRNVGGDHWWRSTVLTDRNPDPDKRCPVFDTMAAQEIFDEMINRGLLVERKIDGAGIPAYVMKYDLDGWDKAVSDGQPFRGKWLLVKRNWLLMLITFIVACFLSTLETRGVGFIDRCIDSVIATENDDGADGDSSSKGNATDTQPQKDEPNNADHEEG